MTPYKTYNMRTEEEYEADIHPRPVKIPPVMMILRGPYRSRYFPVSGMAIAKHARNTENGINISLAVTGCPRVVVK
jgi:hypothetical protein